MSPRLTVAACLDVVGIVYADLAAEILRPLPHVRDRLEPRVRMLEELLEQGGRDPEKYLLPSTKRAAAKVRAMQARISGASPPAEAGQ